VLVDEIEQATFDALQRLEQGQFQRLGDQLLPRLLPELAGLRPYGVNPEGKTRKGVPDSYVGTLAVEATACVEYTTQAADQRKKAQADYNGVRNACPRATVIVLATNRLLPDRETATLRERAEAESITLHVLDGRAIARALARDHQDLRSTFLGIEIDTHSAPSLVAALCAALPRMIPSDVRSVIAGIVVPRPIASERIANAISGREAGVDLIVSPSGSGKTTWSAALAVQLAETTPSVWTPARALRLTVADPIGTMVLQAAYGTSDPSRLSSLAFLLRTQGLVLAIWVDALDEVNNLDALAGAIREFRTSRLFPSARLILTCREEARHGIERVLGDVWNEPSSKERADAPRAITLDRLDDESRTALLVAAGATTIERRRIYETVPSEYLHSPLFLSLAARLARDGAIPAGARTFRRAAIDWLVADVVRRSADGGRRLRPDVVERALGEIAWSIVGGESDSVPVASLSALPDDSSHLSGENTFLAWAHQAGIVAVTDDRVLMRHPVFAEELAATWLSRAEPSRINELLQITDADLLRRLSARIVPSVDDPTSVVRVLRRRDLRAALRTASALDPAKLTDDMVTVLVDDVQRDLLGSPFPSDVRSGIRSLGALRHLAAARALARWFNGLSAPQRMTHRFEIADAFLRQEFTPAISLVLGHRGLLDDWYEPEFHERLRSCSPAFLRVLVEAAVVRLADAAIDEPLPSGPLHVLAITKDDRLIKRLSLAVLERPLVAHEHRALIHFNTPESIEVYAQSVDRYVAAHRSSGADRFDDWYSIVLIGSDVRMFPHDVLVSLIEDTLRTRDSTLRSWASDWAGRLVDPLLVEAVADAAAAEPDWSPRHESYWRGLCKQRSIPELREIIARHPREQITGSIVHHIESSTRGDAAGFLIEFLDDTRHAFSAIHALGSLRNYSTGPHLHRARRQASDSWTRSVADAAIAKLAYRPALHDLVAALGSSDETSHTAEALGRLGGEVAWAALADRGATETNVEHRLRALASNRDPGAVPFIRKLVDSLPAGPILLADALRFDLLELTTDRWKLEVPWIDDPQLFRRLWAAALERSAAWPKEWSHGHYAVKAASHFAGNEVGTLLREIALRNDTVGPEAVQTAELRRTARELLAARGDLAVTRLVVEEELDQRAKENYVGWWLVDRLAHLDRQVLRQALRERIERMQEPLDRWVELLSHFAMPEDRALFLRIEANGGSAAADAAHFHLVRTTLGGASTTPAPDPDVSDQETAGRRGS
jgi:hypothetical protein